VGVFTIANIGAEESTEGARPAAVSTVARLWSLLFPRDAEPLPGGPPRDVPWPEAFEATAGDPAFRWIEDGVAHAWLNTEEARSLAESAGVSLAGAAPEVVRAVHDKGFAHDVCERAGLVPRPLRGLVTSLSPEALLDDDAVSAIRERVAAWPGWTRGRFTLKPRLGSSGRGRVPGELASFDADAMAAALPRLAARGGALLEPWLERVTDLSAQLYIAPDGTVTLLGTLELFVTSSGVYRGHGARLDHRLRITSGSPHDDALLEAAMIVAGAAHAAGYHGPCGIDAFAFVAEDRVVLRPAVELNARFTMGTLVAGLLRRLRPRLRARLPSEPGRLRRLRFELSPGDTAPRSEAAFELPLAEPGEALHPRFEISELQNE